MSRAFVSSVEAEYQRYKSLGEGAIEQLSADELCREGPGGGSSIATLVWHISGNLRSRFLDFLTTDGEKADRNRESEFAPRQVTREALLQKWEEGWAVLLGSLATLEDADLERTVTIRGVPLAVHQALHRSLAHTSHHVGQIVYVAKGIRGGDWHYLSIPPGETEHYNRNPTREKGWM